MSVIEAVPQPSLEEIFDTAPSRVPHVDIIASVGPATDDPYVMEQFLTSIDVARINLAQNNDEDAARRAEQVREVANRIGKDVRVLMDVPGVKLRIGDAAQPVEVEPGDNVYFQFQEFWDPDRPDITPVQHDLSRDAQLGHKILILDGKLVTTITGIDDEGIITAVSESTGRFGPRQGLNLPDTSFPHGYIREDSARLGFVATQQPDYLVASYVQGHADMEAMASDAGALSMTAALGAKVEDKTGMEHIGEIVEASALTVVARGDMGPEIGRHKILAAELRIAVEALRQGKEWAVATGMMESMIHTEAASPADLTDSALAAMLGAKVWLSAETAVNGRVVETVQTLREQVDEYAGRTAMLWTALNTQSNGSRTLAIGNGSH